ncbi:MAG: S-methyl-5'-thioadenosine phosphorylase [Bacteroidota bacterium]
MTKIGIIGGSGFENPELIRESTHLTMNTPYGDPSAGFRCGKIGDTEVVFLSRHGKKHTIPPTLINSRANIWALKELECTHIIATTACGSLRDEIGIGDLVIPDQFIDFTRFRKITYFDEFAPGQLMHTAMADPFDAYLRQKLIEAARELGLKYHDKGTIITIEGPRFSTRAESKMFRIWGADIINMSVAPEAILANELSLPYAAIAISTDYDCWKEEEKPVTWDDVLKIFNQNVANVVRMIETVVGGVRSEE